MTNQNAPLAQKKYQVLCAAQECQMKKVQTR